MFLDRCHKCGRLAQIVERNSRCYDPDLDGIGSSSKLAARYNTFIPVLQPFTPSRTERYLIQMASEEVPDGYRCTVTSLWQYLEIGSYQPVGVGDDRTTQLVPCQVLSQGFKFPDGNTTWSLLWRPGKPYNDSRPDPIQRPGTYRGLRAQGSALLYNSFNPRYTPPNAGDPGGDPIGSLTGFTHLRNPVSGQSLQFAYQVDGPGTLHYVVSVWQTNPLTRQIWTPPNNMDLGAFSREERYIWAMDTIETPGDTKARYTHVGGGFSAQGRPLCCENDRPGVWDALTHQPAIHVPINAPGNERPS